MKWLRHMCGKNNCSIILCVKVRKEFEFFAEYCLKCYFCVVVSVAVTQRDARKRVMN